MLRAQRAGGERRACARCSTQIVGSIRAVCLLTGCARRADLARAPRHLGAPLRAFLDDLGASRQPMTAIGLGKIILLGEHAVVYGYPALAAALDRGVTHRRGADARRWLAAARHPGVEPQGHGRRRSPGRARARARSPTRSSSAARR